MKKFDKLSIFCFRMVAVLYLLGTITFNVIYFGIPELMPGIPIWLVIFASGFSISLSVWMLHQARLLQKRDDTEISNGGTDSSTIMISAVEKTRIKLMYFGAFACWTAVIIILYMYGYSETMSSTPFWFPPALIFLFAVLGSFLIKLVKRKKG